MPEGQDFEACAVCGRTILRGERIAEYATPDGSRLGVCALCKPVAEQVGWVPAAQAGSLPGPAARRRRGAGLRRRLARVSEAARGLGTRADNGEEPIDGPPPERPRVAEESPSQRSRERTSGSGGSKGSRRSDGSRARSGSTRPTTRASRERVMRRGIELFNASSEPRKVAGLIRSLGEPQVAVRPGSGGSVVVTVAWELSWYQWRIAAQEGAVTIRQSAKGNEVDELAERDRAWNASAGENGNVSLELTGAAGASTDRP